MACRTRSYDRIYDPTANHPLFESKFTFEAYIKQSKHIKSNGHLLMKLSFAYMIYQNIFLSNRIRNKVSTKLLVRIDYYSDWQIDNDMISS